MPAVEAEEHFRALLREKRTAHTKAGGRCNFGPHVADLRVFLYRGSLPSRPAAECSTGQQKALLIALVLAHTQLSAAHRSAPPLLLLDDVAAFLDQDRRDHLFAALLATGSQFWLTGTDKQFFTPLQNMATCLRVEDGNIFPSSL
jgi:DNA replication and repair protein RecF